MKKLLFLSLAVCFFSAVNAQTKDSTLQQYVGKYKFAEGSVIAEVDVTLEGGALSMASSAGVSPLEKQSEDLYTITQFQGTAKFNRNAEKKVIGVTINAMGYTLEGTKVETGAAAASQKLEYMKESFAKNILFWNMTGKHKNINVLLSGVVY